MTSYVQPPPLTPVTAEERRAIDALQRLAKRWPQSLRLLSMDGALLVIHMADADYISDSNDTAREDRVLAYINGIPNDGGAW